jgi:hypothetical protein
MGRSRTHARATAKGNMYIYDVKHAPAAYLARGGG